MVTRILIAIALCSLGACEKRSTKYCGLHDNDLANCEQTDAALPDPVACTMDNQCSPGFCELGANICVECLTNANCPSDEHCDVGNSYKCRGCIDDMDCPGGACLPDGKCADDATVIYVGEGGTNNADCKFSSPCATFATALALVTGTRKFIRVTGTITEAVTTTVDVEIIGGANAVLMVPSGVGIKTTGAVVGVYDLTVVCTGDQDGIETDSGSSLTLDRVTITGCNHDAGVDIHGGHATILRSEIYGNPAGGIRLDGKADYTIVNNFIHHNGTLTAGFGIDAGTDSVRNEKLEFNTIVANSVAGIKCARAIVAPNNIIAANLSTVVLSNNVVTCVPGNSLVNDAVTPFAFVHPDAPPYDYHIGATSIAKDMADGTSAVLDDIDGELRPQGAGKDFGADEYKAP